jgi:hypothetical protein
VGFADIVVEYFDSGNGSLICPEAQGGSFPPPAATPTCVPFSAALGDDPGYPDTPADYVSIPEGSFLTLGFVDEVVVDGPDDDIFILEVGDASELADIYISSQLSIDPGDYTFLGQANGNTISSFDLADIGFTDQVRAIKVVSLQNGGAPAAPGFDLASIEALQFQPTAVPALSPFGVTALVVGLLAAGVRRLSRQPKRSRSYRREWLRSPWRFHRV